MTMLHDVNRNIKHMFESLNIVLDDDIDVEHTNTQLILLAVFREAGNQQRCVVSCVLVPAMPIRLTGN